MASKKYEEKYTKPDLREELKEDIKQSDKGGKPGQWSARKSQMLVKEYEKQGGGYKKDKKDDAAKSLEEWTDQDWQTMDGKGDARHGEATKRYLPKKVWEQLTQEEKKEAERTKKRASKDGKQFVPWTPAIKKAFEDADISTHDISVKDTEPTQEELYSEAQDLDIEGRSNMSKKELQKAVNEQKNSKLEKLSRDELYDKAQEQDIEGRSNMNKSELIEALQNT